MFLQQMLASQKVSRRSKKILKAPSNCIQNTFVHLIYGRNKSNVKYRTVNGTEFNVYTLDLRIIFNTKSCFTSFCHQVNSGGIRV